MIPEETVAWLENTQGLVSAAEGYRLAELAYDVPANQRIVEIGTHTGLSTCWMAAGSREGHGAHIIAVDPWGEPTQASDDPWDLGPEGVLERFHQNVAGTTQEVPREDFGDLVTALRTTSEVAASIWCAPIGLLFIDAIHTYDAVKRDHELWAPHVVRGGIVALHDFGDSYPGCRDAIIEIVDSGRYVGEITDSLWVGRKK